jgi:hypothetical protein
MKHLEINGHWYDGILNSFPFCIDDKYILSNGIAWGFKENGKWNFKPRITGNTAQYFNALIFVRLALPFGVFVATRLTLTRLFQAGFGWKMSGRFAIHCRLQTDASAAAGYHVGMPNVGQAQGWDYGGH